MATSKHFLKNHLFNHILFRQETFVLGRKTDCDKLNSLSFRFNNLEGEISNAIGNLISLNHLDLSGNQLQGKVPASLGDLCKLKEKDLSYNGINQDISEILRSLSKCCLESLESLSMIDNQLSSHLTHKLGQFKNLAYLNLARNNISGPIPLSKGELSSLKDFEVSKNQLNGSLSEFVCNSSVASLSVLNIDTNLLSGEIPDCWNFWWSLRILNLENNNLTGIILSSLGDASLEMLNLRNNSMFGELPSTLQSYRSLVFLDLSENHFSGRIPAWIGDKLSYLMVLSLRSNNFGGHIPHQICALQSLQILDLGLNDISGAISKCLRNLSAMATKEKQSKYYYEAEMFVRNAYSINFLMSASLVLKGREDLNLLTGNIPDIIGDFKLMESLDLSMNHLHGGIPSRFSNLNFLNHFNVSYNNLTGQIPTDTQLQSFENSSFMGNHLCGPLVSKSCSTKGVPTEATKNGESSGRSRVNGFYVSMVVGFVMGFWGVVAPLFFIRSWSFMQGRKITRFIATELNLML
ncbi:receptor-like protein EIX2 [Hibiscus syriacus]|uniref:receptor-like protein EIX2 n=1 Tax=Hibiscus syriacus TaxID=106335 RepID=UPI00192323C4|nr:receptor-like protein EIX2 [Hibiscus syriacus]